MKFTTCVTMFCYYIQVTSFSKFDSVEKSLSKNSLLKNVKLELDVFYPKELSRSCLVGILCSQTVTIVDFSAHGK